MKTKIKHLIAFVIIFIIFISISNIVMAEKDIKIIEPININAEDIGIKEMAIGDDFENEEVIEDGFSAGTVDDQIESENKIMDEDVSDNEKTEEVTESPEVPEGKAEGYVAGTYFEPNEDDCDVAEVCYSCENDGHINIHCVSYNEDNDSYVYEEWCEVCGHGSDKIISNEEFEALGVDTDMEF